MMPSIVLIDTSIFLNLLDIPGYNQDKLPIYSKIKEHINNGDSLFLPIATLWETGDHIADIRDGTRRREYGEKFVEIANQALQGDAPYIVTNFTSKEDFKLLLKSFPDVVMCGSSKKPGEGTSLSDHSIIEECKRLRKQYSMTSVYIWSLDADLAAYGDPPV